MNRVDAINHIISKHKKSVFIFSNGLTSREASFYCKNDSSFYLLHAMGEAYSVGVGLSISLPELEIVVIDGDGNALMGASSWILRRTNNFHYYILKNNKFATTGGQLLPDNTEWPNWCNVVEIEDKDKIRTPNPPSPKEIWSVFNKWLSNNKKGK